MIFFKKGRNFCFLIGKKTNDIENKYFDDHLCIHLKNKFLAYLQAIYKCINIFNYRSKQNQRHYCKRPA